MPLQNRVTPFGEIVAVSQRGTLTGNRGIIHDPHSRTLLKRRWTTKAWIACVCEFRGRKREVMATQSWTELFFLDEATAFAAGHRPCFYCRRDDALRFRDAWARGNGVARASAPQIDAALHADRLDGRAKRTHPLTQPISDLPDGVMVASGGSAWLIVRGRALRWSLDGYSASDESFNNPEMLTPPSTVRTFAAGYSVALHPSVARVFA